MKITYRWQHGMGSFSKDHLVKNGIAESAIVAETVPCISFSELVANYVPPNKKVDLLMTYTEGFDAEILTMIDFKEIRPFVIKFEVKHLERAVAVSFKQRLVTAGYVLEVSGGGYDCVAVDKGLASRGRFLETWPASDSAHGTDTGAVAHGFWHSADNCISSANYLFAHGGWTLSILACGQN